jgi:alanine dehydrogenase
MAVGLGAEVSVLDVDQRRLSHLYDIYHGGISTLYSNMVNLEQTVLEADIVIGAVLLPGGARVDQGGCVETIRPTSQSRPTYIAEGVIHYGVPNMPGAVPRTSTLALTSATFPYLYEMCSRGPLEALRSNRTLARGVNCYRGAVTLRGVADVLAAPLAQSPWS